MNKKLIDRAARAMYEQTSETCHIEGHVQTLSKAARGDDWKDLPARYKRILRNNAKAALSVIVEGHA